MADTPDHRPYVPDEKVLPELTLPAVLVGAVLGVVFGASSLYLCLKVGITVSASIPIAVLSITLFRAFSDVLGIRKATILENNITQTTGSAGESLAFGVCVTMPTLMLLGFEMDAIRVMTVATLGGLLGILMMIPLRRAFIVNQHESLPYPEGTACAEVLVAGDKGGATARMVFLGFGLAFVHKFLNKALNLWKTTPTVELADEHGNGLKGAEAAGELTPELLGVGFLIGPRIASMMMTGAVLSYLVVGPVIATVGAKATEPVPPAQWEKPAEKDPVKRLDDPGLIRNMDAENIYKNYLKYIGAGAVACAGIISMLRALPLIVSSLTAGLRDVRATRSGASAGPRRTERDLPPSVVVFGSLGLVVALAAIPALGLGLTLHGILGAVMILLFGFLFVTVSSRMTGLVGSSSNPISGMTIAALLMTCLIFLALGKTDTAAMLIALTVASVVCIASSNGGTTSQDLKTGYLVGATPAKQQIAILVGALTSAAVIGFTLLMLNEAGTIYTTQELPERPIRHATDSNRREKVGRPYADKDSAEYRVVHVRRGEYPADEAAGLPEIKPGRYLVADDGRIAYRTDPAINGSLKKDDFDAPAPERFKPPQPTLFATIIQGILGGTLEWALVTIGALIAVALELAGVSALPVAVGMYIEFGTTAAIFLGGLLRGVADKLRGPPASEAEAETGPGVLLAAGYIAGGTLMGVIIAFFAFAPEFFDRLKIGPVSMSAGVSVGIFVLLAAVLLWVGTRKRPPDGERGASAP